MTRDEIFAALGIRPEEVRDLHVLRNFSPFVGVSDGRVIAMTDPWMRHCPLFEMLQGWADGVDVAELRLRIRAAVEDKIARFGMFTARRQLIRDDVAVPYGASEMMMVALRRGGLDAAVTVCDGAGTVVAANPDLTHPGPKDTVVPESGALLAALLACTSRVKYRIIGKPELSMFRGPEHRLVLLRHAVPARAVADGGGTARR